jgi:hypothetical protein
MLGTHLPVLAEMFPSHKWILVDPAPFTAEVLRNMVVLQQCFTNEMAAQYSGQGVLFISDVRSVNAEDEVCW